MYQSLRDACWGSFAWRQCRLSINACVIASTPSPVRMLSAEEGAREGARGFFSVAGLIRQILPPDLQHDSFHGGIFRGHELSPVDPDARSPQAWGPPTFGSSSSTLEQASDVGSEIRRFPTNEHLVAAGHKVCFPRFDGSV